MKRDQRAAKRQLEQEREDYRQSLSNLKAMNKPRKKPTKSFIAVEDGPECSRCFEKITRGQRIRHNPEGELVHYAHNHPEVTYDICQQCFLAKPCDCDD